MIAHMRRQRGSGLPQGEEGGHAPRVGNDDGRDPASRSRAVARWLFLDVDVKRRFNRLVESAIILALILLLSVLGMRCGCPPPAQW